MLCMWISGLIIVIMAGVNLYFERPRPAMGLIQMQDLSKWPILAFLLGSCYVYGEMHLIPPSIVLPNLKEVHLSCSHVIHCAPFPRCGQVNK